MVLIIKIAIFAFQDLIFDLVKLSRCYYAFLVAETLGNLRIDRKINKIHFYLRC